MSTQSLQLEGAMALAAVLSFLYLAPSAEAQAQSEAAALAGRMPYQSTKSVGGSRCQHNVCGPVVFEAVPKGKRLEAKHLSCQLRIGAGTQTAGGVALLSDHNSKTEDVVALTFATPLSSSTTDYFSVTSAGVLLFVGPGDSADVVLTFAGNQPKDASCTLTGFLDPL